MVFEKPSWDHSMVVCVLKMLINLQCPNNIKWTSIDEFY